MISSKLNQATRSIFVVVFSLSANTYAQKKRGYDAPNKEEFYSTAEKELAPAARKQADDLRVETISQIKKLLTQKGLQNSQQFELMLRLGELYAERHDYIRDREILDYEQKHSAWLAAGKKGREPKLSDKESKNQLASAALAFRDLVRKYPKHPRAAAAMFALGKTLTRLNDDNGIHYFTQLIKLHSKSPYVPDSYVSLGEYYFEKNDMARAVTNYRQLLNFKEHPSYPYAVYKMGWAYFSTDYKTPEENKKLLQLAMTSFKLVVKLSDEDKKTKLKRIDLREEAMKDLIMVYSETGDIEGAFAYFRSIGEKGRFYQLLERLGSIYMEQGQNEKAVIVFKRLLEESPHLPGNVDVSKRLVEIYDRMGQISLAVQTLRSMQENYVNPKGGWYRANMKDAELLQTASKTTAFLTQRFGTLYHKRGQESKNQSLTKAANVLYASYLQTFPQDPTAYEMRFYYADVNESLGNLDLAAAQYLIVAKENSQTKHQESASFQAVSVINRVDVAQKYPPLPNPGTIATPMALPPIKKRLIEALDLYVGLFPKKKDSPVMRFTAAKTFYDYGNYDEAEKRFRGIIAADPTSKQAEASIRLLVIVPLNKKDWKKVESLTEEFLKNPAIVDKKLKEDLVAQQKSAIFNHAQTLEQSGSYRQSAEEFLKFQKKYPGDKENSEKALVNAANNYFRIAELEKGVEVNRKLIAEYPQSKFIRKAVLDIAQTYEALADYKNAATQYRQFAMSFPKDDQAAPALYNAAMLMRGLEQVSESLQLFERFATLYPMHPLAGDAYFAVAEAHEKVRAVRESSKAYQNAAKIYAKSDQDKYFLSLAKAAELSTNNAQGMRPIMTQLQKSNAPPALEARRVVAKRLFELTNQDTERFMKEEILVADNLERNVGNKQKQLVSIASRLEQVMSVKSPEYSVASLFRLGQLNETFSRILQKIPPPRDADQVAASQFKSAIEKVAFPLREEGFKFYESAYKNAQQVETLTEWSIKAYAKMTEMNPTEYPEIQEISVEPGYMSHSFSAVITAKR